MDTDNRELFVIGVAMIFFLLICVVAVALFVRQWRRERRPPGTDRHDRP
ncbi:MAG TPA: hypothetical protein VF546_03325 [Pyrinomonadaceae bacterium]|jgi:hypothetical protein